jgi:pimeloyl-ACP methyl ester carboxylesterase
MRFRWLLSATAILILLATGDAAAYRATSFSYQSGHDGVTLQANAIYPDSTPHPPPILFVLHGYTNDMNAVFATQAMLADRGLFTIGPAMRGRDGSGGTPDDSAWELQDIVDAIPIVGRQFPAEADTGNVNVVGYSGGGGNTFGLMSKFPDTFRLAAAFFGMSDYGYDLMHGWYEYGGQGYQSVLRQRIGGSPYDVPNLYMARSSLLAVRNNRYTAFQMYVDSQEATCPAYNDTTYLRIAADIGLANVSLDMSNPSSPYRWTHGYPSDYPDLVVAFDYFVPGILAGSYPAPVVDHTGEQTVIGYVSVRPYTLVLSDGKSEVADLTYDVSGDTETRARAWTFELSSRTGWVPVYTLLCHGFAPLTSYTFEDEDVTHGVMRTSQVRTDSSGELRLGSFLNTVSRLRIYRTDAAAVDGKQVRSANIAVYPNPFGEAFTLRSPGPARISIYDCQGRLILARDSVSGTTHVRPDRVLMPPGTYWLRFGAKPASRGIQVVRLR